MKSLRPKQVSTKLFNSRKGSMPIITGGLMVVGAIVIGFFALKGAGVLPSGDSEGVKLQASGYSVQTNPDNPNEVIVNNCGSDRETSYDSIIYNPLDDDGTATYISVTEYVQSVNGGALRTYTTDSDGTFASSSLTLDCGGKYMAYVPAVQNTTVSAMFEVDTTGPTWDNMIGVEKVDHITVYAYDNKNKGFVYASTGEAAGTAKEMSSSGIEFDSTTNQTAYAMGTGSNLDMTFTVYTGATQTQWGDMKNYIVLDADKSDFGAPALSWNNVALTEVGMSALNTDDAAYLAGYEYVFALPDNVEEVTKELRLKVNAKSGQNPDSDIKVRFLTESLHVDGTEIVQSIFDEGGNEIFTSPAQEITIDIS